MNNLDKFKQDANETIGLIHLAYPNLVNFTMDNSFVIMLEKLCNALLGNIQEAIDGKEITCHKGIEPDIDRYVKTIASSADYRVPEKNVIDVLKKVNIIFLNWLRLLEEQELTCYRINIDSIKNNMIEINTVLDMSMTVDRLIHVANKLINKAEGVLAAAPKSFNLSRHFAEAMQKEIDD